MDRTVHHIEFYGKYLLLATVKNKNIAQKYSVLKYLI